MFDGFEINFKSGKNKSAQKVPKGQNFMEHFEISSLPNPSRAHTPNIVLST